MPRWWPIMVWSLAPVSAFQVKIRADSSPEAMISPSELQATAIGGWGWPTMDRIVAWVAASMMRTVLSSQEQTNREPLGPAARASGRIPSTVLRGLT